MKTTISLLLYCALTFFTWAETRVQPPAATNLIGAWVGYQEDGLKFCRLELNADGKGFFASTVLDQPAQLHLVTEWSVNDFDIKLILTPVDDKKEPIFLRGQAGWRELKLEMGGILSGWQRKLNLIQEQPWLEKNKRVKEHIDKYRKEQAVEKKKQDAAKKSTESKSDQR
jgi:hypothetical protein